MRIIGIAGHIGSGKNLAASMIPGACVVEWSDRLYAGLSAMLGVPVAALKHRHAKENGLAVAGMHIDVRRALQTLGTEWGRDTVSENLWVNLTMQSIVTMANACGSSVFAIPGTRFPNEVAAVRDRGGEIWWIDRPGVLATSHASDHQICASECDRVILNDRGPDELRSAVMNAWEEAVCQP